MYTLGYINTTDERKLGTLLEKPVLRVTITELNEIINFFHSSFTYCASVYLIKKNYTSKK